MVDLQFPLKYNFSTSIHCRSASKFVASVIPPSTGYTDPVANEARPLSLCFFK